MSEAWCALVSLPDVIFQVLMSRQLPPGNLRPRRSARLVDNGSFLVVRLQTKTGGFVRSTADGDVVTPTAAPGRGGIASSAAAAVPASQPDSTAAAAGVRAEGSAYPGGGSAATVCGGGGGGGAAGMVEGGGGGGEPVASSDQRWGGGTRAGGRDTGGGGANCHWILIVHHVGRRVLACAIIPVSIFSLFFSLPFAGGGCAHPHVQVAQPWLG